MIDVEKIRKILDRIRNRLLTRASENRNNSEYLLDIKPGNAKISSPNYRDSVVHDDVFADVPDEDWVCTNPLGHDDGGEGSGYEDHPGNPGSVGGSRSVGAWPSKFPKVCVQTNGKRMKDHSRYQAAKKGDYQAASELVRDLSKPDRIKQLVESYPDAIVVPVQSAGSGHNQIPVAYADLIGEYGAEVDHGIQITQKANRTGSSEMHRLLSSNKIDGVVKKGAKYVIVDDVVTSGASINEYRQYIEDKGGIVVAATTMCMGQAGSNQISPTQEAINKVYSKHGEERISRLCQSIGVDQGIESMTNWQVNYIRSCSSSKVDKIIEQGKEND